VILVLGSSGFLGKRVSKLLNKKEKEYKTTSLSTGIDLRNFDEANNFFKKVKPEYILNCAAFVGGIQFGMKNAADIFRNNLQITLNLLELGKVHKIKRIVNPISNCAYPGDATYFKEEEFWNGQLHESVMVYGHARKSSWVGSWAYSRQFKLDVINLILSNMYGPEDHFEEERSHAFGALVMKIAEAYKNNLPSVSIWGTGKPIREWLHVDDGAEAMVRALEVEPYLDPINIGIGKGISIIELAEMISAVVGYKGKLVLDPSKPDGASKKTVDGSTGIKLFNWKPSRSLKKGVEETVEYYMNNIG
jgi:GDP-L-fucose synthase